MRISDPPVIVKQQFNVSADELWQVITETNHMHQWFFAEIPVFDPKVGFETSFMISTPEREFLHQWKIIEVIPNQKIVYDWSYEGYEGRGEVEFLIATHGDSSLLTLTNTTREDWPQDIPEFKRESAEGGWQYFINQRLVAHVATLDQDE